VKWHPAIGHQKGLPDYAKTTGVVIGCRLADEVIE
jgi:hypothetical protein